MQHLALLLLLLGVAGAQPWLPAWSQQASNRISPPPSRNTATAAAAKAAGTAGPGITLPATTSSSSSSSSASSSSSSTSSSKAAGPPVQPVPQRSSASKPAAASSSLSSPAVSRAPGRGISKPPAAAPVAVSGGRVKQATEQGSPSTSTTSNRNSSSSPRSSSNSSEPSPDLCSRPQVQPGPWPLSAIEADAAGLSGKTDRLLICLVSSGVIASSPFLAHNSLGGCSKEDPLDPGGCLLTWNSPEDAADNWKKRGTLLAAIMAANGSVDPRVRGVLPVKTELYVVPVSLDPGPGYGALDPAATATGGTSRLRAYSVCEGRLRGLQSQDYGLIPPAPSRWRMVMLVDVAQPKTTTSVGSDFPVTEAEWFKAATLAAEGAPGDILVVAPAGDNPATDKVAYPAAINQVLAVAASGCHGQALKNYSDSGSKPDLTAPGVDIPLPAARRGSSDQVAAATDVEVWSEYPSHAAAAYVAAAAARLWNEHPNCPADSIRRALVESTQVAARAREPSPLNLKKAAAYLKTFKCSPSSSSRRRRLM